MKYHRRTLAEIRVERERAELERVATQLIKDADRQRWKRSLPRAAPRPPETPTSSVPKSYRLSDLSALRAKGRVP